MLRRCCTSFGLLTALATSNAVGVDISEVLIQGTITVTPELVQFYQEFPLSTGETLLRGAYYRHRDETREQRLARQLAIRIDRDTMEEDVQLTEWSNEAMNSSAFKGFYLSDLEYGVRTHHDHLRAILPVATLRQRPAEEDIERLNTAMRLAAG